MGVVVTGAAGFIGRHLVAALAAAGRDVVAIDRCRDVPAGAHTALCADLVDADGPVASALREADAVFHLAAFPGVREHGPAADARRRHDNVLAMAAVLARVPAGTPLVVTSSSSVYGGSDGRPCAETDAPHPRGGYAASKLEVERLCAQRAAGGGRVAVARPFTVAGEGQRPDMAIARWIAAARAGLPLTILGSPNRRRDVTDVTDVVEGLVRIADREVAGTVNLGTGVAHRLADIAAAVLRATGSDAPTVVRPAGAVEPAATLADTRRCAALLGFTPRTDLDGLIRRQVAVARTDAPSVAAAT